jgi:hypothetical protein
MEPASNPLDLLRQRRAINRVEAAMRKTEETPKAGGYRYLGRNADTGQGLVAGNDGSVIPGDIITSGHIKPGQAVRVAQAGGMVQLDQKPRVRKVTPVVDSKAVAGNIKILFSVIEGSENVFYIGGDRETPKEVYRESIPAYGFSTDGYITNSGKGLNKWVIGIQSGPSNTYNFRKTGLKTLTPTEVLSNTFPGNYPYWRGHGNWVEALYVATVIASERTYVQTLRRGTPPFETILDQYRSYYDTRLDFYSVFQGEASKTEAHIITNQLTDWPDSSGLGTYGSGTISGNYFALPGVSRSYSISSLDTGGNNGGTGYEEPASVPYIVLYDDIAKTSIIQRSEYQYAPNLAPIASFVSASETVEIDGSILFGTSDPYGVRSIPWVTDTNPLPLIFDKWGLLDESNLVDDSVFRVVFSDGLKKEDNGTGKISVDSLSLRTGVFSTIKTKFFPVTASDAVIHSASYHP